MEWSFKSLRALEDGIKVVSTYEDKEKANLSKDWPNISLIVFNIWSGMSVEGFKEEILAFLRK